MTYENEIAIFAARFNVTPESAAILPALFHKAARTANTSTGSIINTATYFNRELGEYLVSVADKVAAETRKTS